MHTYRSPFLSPNGKMLTPVSIGDLPSSMYRVAVETLTEEVTSHLEANPEIPGVILMRDGVFHGAIPRAVMFERLGHRYGIELFLRKPIIELQQNLQVGTLTISSNLRIKDAVQIALQRDPKDMYSPLVVFNDSSASLLDMHTLLIAQSHILDNASNIFGRMNAIEESLKRNIPFDELVNLVLDSIMSVVPHHRANIFVKPSRWLNLPITHPLLHRIPEELEKTMAFRIVLEMQQAAVIDDAHAHPQRQRLNSLGSFRTWIGLPLQTLFGVEGLLSLSRFSLTSFTREEVELARSFTDYFGLALSEPADIRHYSMRLERNKRRLGLYAAG